MKSIDLKKLPGYVFIVFAWFIFYSCTSKKVEKEEENEVWVLDYVDPNIGSVHGRWFFYTPASTPFGMAKLAPHTNAYGSKGGWLPCGYDDRQHSIEGFGHFHEFQIGGLVTMPVTGPLKTLPGTLENPDAGYRSRFDKKDEFAEPGYYKVLLKDYGITAELTASERVGFHRYTFPQSDQSRIIFDVGHKQGESSDVVDAWIALDDKRELVGSITTYPEYVKFCEPGARVKMYFVAVLSKTPESYGTFRDKKVFMGQKEARGPGIGMFLNYSTKEGEKIEMRVGLSYTSIENARKNLITEGNEKTFGDIKRETQEKWNEKLSRIVVEGGKEEDRIKFYTGLYHALLGRGIASDVSGDYPSGNGGIGHIPLDSAGKPEYNHYNTDGIWGAFWNLTQLWGLVYPEYLSEYLRSNLDHYRDTGWMHDGIAAEAYANGVPSNFFGLVLASAYQWGIRDFDMSTAWAAARKNELEYHNRPFGCGKYDLSYFIKRGYIPLKDTTISNGWVFNFGASHTLEYSFSSYAVAEFARALGKEEDYRKLINYASGYKKLFDPETKFMRPREMDGSFMKDYDPSVAWKGFQEGNGYQYTWYVPQDPAGLIRLMGEELFNDRLSDIFSKAQKSLFGGGKEIDSFSGLEKPYNHGNQPSLHISWLFNYSHRPWETQKWSRAVCNVFYGITPEHGYGYGQDEDQGQLGAWYVMASMGLFDVRGGTGPDPTVQIGSPLFDKITIRLNPEYYSGKEFVIKTVNNGPENIYVQEAELNGEVLNKCWFRHKLLTAGGTLTLTMGPKPNEEWGSKAGDEPPSMSTYE